MNQTGPGGQGTRGLREEPYAGIRTLDFRSGLPADLASAVPRAGLDVNEALGAVAPIVAEVARRGAAAVLDFGAQFDGVRPPSLRVPMEVMTHALAALDPAVRSALEESISRVRKVHADQVRPAHTTQVVPGGSVTMRCVPVARVGLYVPGGEAVYPSSVVMNVVPAQIAGVPSVAIASPPQAEWGGWPHPTILAAAALLGVDEVYAAGGAQAIALFAYGAELPAGGRCAPVNLVTGPGNIWVTAAKRLLKGRIGIDAEAGPTEIAILADSSADPLQVAADLISQAEHDVLAAAVLVTDSSELATAVAGELARQVPVAKHARRIATSLSGEQSAIILVASLADGLRVVDAYAAEHLEVHTVDARAVAERVHNAGAIFVGPWAPVSLGDYAAGSNHVLPTGGAACHSSGLGVAAFLRAVNLIEYDQAALRGVADAVMTLASAEDLPAHGEAIRVRVPS
ncbi:MAG: histidinol dehydrogenase [Candidatus Nanopelagicales bacterium]